MTARTPFFPHRGVVIDEASRLLADVYAMEELQKIDFQNGGNDPFSDFWDVLNERVEKAMLTTATLARSNDDDSNGLARHSDHFPDGVGTLTSNGSTVPLSARDACNKILHATNGHWEYEVTDAHPILQRHLDAEGIERKTQYLAPRVVLTGEHRGMEWEATVDLVKWVHAVTKYAI